MTEEFGIKETKEAYIGGNRLGIFFVKRMKDGIGFDDAFALIKKLATDEDPEFKAIMKAAFDKIGQVPKEIADLSMIEGMELATMSIGFVPMWIEAFKKEA